MRGPLKLIRLFATLFPWELNVFFTPMMHIFHLEPLLKLSKIQFSDTLRDLGAPKDRGPQANVYLAYGLRRLCLDPFQINLAYIGQQYYSIMGDNHLSKISGKFFFNQKFFLPGGIQTSSSPAVVYSTLRLSSICRFRTNNRE